MDSVSICHLKNNQSNIFFLIQNFTSQTKFIQFVHDVFIYTPKQIWRDPRIVDAGGSDLCSQRLREVLWNSGV